MPGKRMDKREKAVFRFTHLLGTIAGRTRSATTYGEPSRGPPALACRRLLRWGRRPRGHLREGMSCWRGKNEPVRRQAAVRCKFLPLPVRSTVQVTRVIIRCTVAP